MSSIDALIKENEDKLKSLEDELKNNITDNLKNNININIKNIQGFIISLQKIKTNENIKPKSTENIKIYSSSEEEKDKNKIDFNKLKNSKVKNKGLKNKSNKNIKKKYSKNRAKSYDKVKIINNDNLIKQIDPPNNYNLVEKNFNYTKNTLKITTKYDKQIQNKT